MAATHKVMRKTVSIQRLSAGTWSPVRHLLTRSGVVVVGGEGVDDARATNVQFV